MIFKLSIFLAVAATKKKKGRNSKWGKPIPFSQLPTSLSTVDEETKMKRGNQLVLETEEANKTNGVGSELLEQLLAKDREIEKRKKKTTASELRDKELLLARDAVEKAKKVADEAAKKKKRICSERSSKSGKKRIGISGSNSES